MEYHHYNVKIKNFISEQDNGIIILHTFSTRNATKIQTTLGLSMHIHVKTEEIAQ